MNPSLANGNAPTAMARKYYNYPAGRRSINYQNVITTQMVEFVSFIR